MIVVIPVTLVFYTSQSSHQNVSFHNGDFLTSSFSELIFLSTDQPHYDTSNFFTQQTGAARVNIKFLSGSGVPVAT